MNTSFIAYEIKKLVAQRIMVKTASRSDRHWSTIFCVIVYFSSLLSLTNHEVNTTKCLHLRSAIQIGHSELRFEYFAVRNEQEPYFTTTVILPRYLGRGPGSSRKAHRITNGIISWKILRKDFQKTYKEDGYLRKILQKSPAFGQF